MLRDIVSIDVLHIKYKGDLVGEFFLTLVMFTGFWDEQKKTKKELIWLTDTINCQNLGKLFYTPWTATVE